MVPFQGLYLLNFRGYPTHFGALEPPGWTQWFGACLAGVSYLAAQLCPTHKPRDGGGGVGGVGDATLEHEVHEKSAPGLGSPACLGFIYVGDEILPGYMGILKIH